MPRQTLHAAAAALFLIAAAFHPEARAAARPDPAIVTGEIAVLDGMRLRRLVAPNPGAGTAVLLLHGFPETAMTWEALALDLAGEFEVHAFDWPGYGFSSRPGADRFAYAPKDYAAVLKAYIEESGLDRSRLIIYATDIGALPALLLALEEPDIARTIIVGDFAPFDRPAFMYPSLQALKSPATAEAVRGQMNAGRDEILRNAFHRGLPAEARFEISAASRQDMAAAWGRGGMTTADAFHHYYSHFSRDQAWLEANVANLRTPVKVIWGEDDVYIRKEMGAEFAARIGVELTLLPGVGHYPHLQAPHRILEEIRAAAAPANPEGGRGL